MAKIILTTDVANLGGPGDIVEVKDGYARNYLLPRGFAITATKGAEKNIRTIRRVQEARRIRDLDHAKEIRSTLKDLGTIRVQGKAAEGSKKLFGSITAADIVDAIKSAGGPQLDKRVIDTGKQHIKTLGKHQVQARLHPEVTVDLQLEVVSQ
ncbi:50S ribosomal protein L9 [Saccharomonospora viridis]|jgi:large subunit ribosomal protein L9|uniref:Large ribosomal subunit protein bL9 n=2 Tax=Saccharomonospora viridis TaxID=1852 RepID=C7MS28_SACVD|nr:50S ribosomal protein L9 [Saccharomonospora viridis]ACU98884.1 LSU ribosomal protein L9P [Saccharomonospora viridis DSM 43017]KHF44683.1 50S ribosomal protein L9 [Saccharomonospora viridis]SFP22859.1 large subunit ribosomal protein L9 [Saccharomonospora viridis]